jgi:hypothetical protein
LQLISPVVTGIIKQTECTFFDFFDILIIFNTKQPCTVLKTGAKQSCFTSRSIEINSENMSGETALHVASRWGFLDILKILLDYGAQVNTKNKRRETPIR